MNVDVENGADDGVVRCRAVDDSLTLARAACMINTVLARRKTLHHDSLVVEALLRMPLGAQDDTQPSPKSYGSLDAGTTQLSRDV